MILQTAFEKLTQGSIFDAFATRVDVVMGIAPFLALVGTVTFVSLYWWSKSFVVPTVVLVLMGGSLLVFLPAVFARAAWILIAVSGGLAIFAIVWAVIR